MGLITIHNHIHLPDTQSAQLSRIEQKLDQLMALTEQQFTEVLSRIDTATTGIANKISALQEEIKGAGLPASVEESVLAKLGTIATNLEGIAKDPENPTPEEPQP